ncbi:hypothetical protein QG37_02240 [Candidozyma auris]|uniref:Uncharacterized protein n=1 Tax=Candidozyma auris TaxID=498019 RepID=A0A0L0P3A5_CANAR|nr:hypothetical protein QG37_02240 [[Candida] auris]
MQDVLCWKYCKVNGAWKKQEWPVQKGQTFVAGAG